MPIIGAIAICIAALVTLAFIAGSWDSTGSDGDPGTALAAIILTFITVGPAAFAALFVWKMRSSERDNPQLLGVVAAAGLLPALIIGSWSLAAFTQNRGLRTTGVVAVVVMLVLALTWVLIAMRRQPTRTGLLGTAVGVIVLVFTLTAANLNADAHDRALERQAISGENAPLALFDPRGALTERDGWRITQVDSIRVERSRQHGSLGLRLESVDEQRISVLFRSIDEGGHCATAGNCESMLTLENGSVVRGAVTPTGTFFDVPTPHNKGWWVLWTSSSLSARELNEAIELLQPVTVDAWVAALDRFPS